MLILLCLLAASTVPDTSQVLNHCCPNNSIPAPLMQEGLSPHVPSGTKARNDNSTLTLVPHDYMTPEGTVDIIFCGSVLWGVAHLRLKVNVILKLCDAVVFQTMFSPFFLILSFRFT